MRRVLASVLFAGLFSSAAFAEEAAPPPPAPAPAAARKTPLRVVRVLSETHQALLFDKTKGTHVLVETGTTIDGFKVDDIDDDTVTLTPIDGGAQIVLAGPDPSWRRHRDGTPAATKPAAQPEDPYVSAAPVDPYADEIHTAEAPGSTPAPSTTPATAPIAAGDGGVRTVQAPNATPAPVRTVQAPTNDAAAAPTDTAAAAAALNAAGIRTVQAPDASAPVADGPTVIAKADVHAALSNFGSLAGSMRGAFTPTGARLDAVAPDSLLAKAGLRAGDVITSINNQPLRSIDDAANLYARAGSMTGATIQIQRAGKPMSLRLAFQ